LIPNSLIMQFYTTKPYFLHFSILLLIAFSLKSCVSKDTANEEGKITQVEAKEENSTKKKIKDSLINLNEESYSIFLALNKIENDFEKADSLKRWIDKIHNGKTQELLVIGNSDFGKTNSSTRSILDAYVALSKKVYLEQKKNLDSYIYLFHEKSFYQKNSKQFIEELSKEDPYLYFPIREVKSNIWHDSTKALPKDAVPIGYKDLVNFRLRLGRLIYQNILVQFKTKLDTITNNIVAVPEPKYDKAIFSDILRPEYRSAIVIDSLWSICKPTIFAVLSRSNFKKLGYDKVITKLLLAHELIYTKDYKSIFKGIMIEKIKGETFNENYHLPRSKSIDLGSSYWAKYFSNWYYSFWYRRYVEGTDETARKILLEVQNHYK
jgi:hypothetical protein